MASFPADLTLRVVRAVIRWLAPGYEIRSLADLRQLRGQLRLGLIFLTLVLAPGLWLAFLSLNSIRGEELAVWDEVRRRAELAAEATINQSEALFTEFESAARQRLAAGRSPADAPGEVSRYLLVVFRVDETGRVTAPFERAPTDDRPEADLTLTDPWRAAELLERTPGQALAAANAYGALASSARGVSAKALARWARARALASAGQLNEALPLLDSIILESPQVRDVHGFHLGDLARLKRGELLLRSDPAAGEQQLIALVNDQLGARWAIGLGGEHAITNRALEALVDRAPPDWLSSARGRLEEKTRQLFYAEQLITELDVITGAGASLRVSTPDFAYQLTHRTIWGNLWWGDDLYAFALDRQAVVNRLGELAALSTAGDENLSASITGPDDPPPEGLLSRRSLAPWMPGWAIVVYPTDPQRLDRERSLKRAQRLAIIALAIALIATGAVLTVRLVSRELDVAHMKTDFAANVSHELRSPITQIRVKGEALMLGLYEDEADLNQTYEAIVRESERLSRLVDNVLDFSSIERGAKRYNLRPADLGETVRTAVEAARYSMEMRGLTLELSLPDNLPVVPHDPEAVGQVIQNLLSNAAKYGRKGGWIGVKLERVDNGVRISVSDRGIGILPEHLPLVFDRFYRSPDPEARRQKGTGLGLTIVKYIVEAHGGQVSVHSTPGQGTTFALHFPTKSAHPRA